MLKAVLFDHDGTLVDSEGVHCRHWQSVMAGHGVFLTETTYNRELLGIPNEENAKWLIREFRIDATPESLIREKQIAAQNYLNENAFPLIPDAKQVIGLFRAAGIRTGVVSGAERIGPLSTFDSYGLSASMDVLVTGDDVQNRKPSPEGYLSAMAQLDLRPEECLAVEDSGTGVQAAAAAGLTCCAVPTIHTAHHDFSAATHKMSSLTEVYEWAREAYDLSGYVY
ncbi:MAG: HAD family phosphatase [Hyphomicrobiales bacterium]|nr:MAG: HAD family phosphatase [Hyphomicrobiales bacterium]